jgi:carboxylesterase type B
VKPWGDTVFDATREGPKCIQFDEFFQGVHGVEDCFRLNIYTHRVTLNARLKLLNGNLAIFLLKKIYQNENLKPVMVWIHGGGFNSGNGESDFYGPNYILDRDIVFVTINYRLGALKRSGVLSYIFLIYFF